MKTKPKTTTKTKVQKADAPMTRNEFKDAISKMTRNELIGVLCDIYYSQANADSKDGCECECGCESMTTPAKAKKSVKRSKVSKKK